MKVIGAPSCDVSYRDASHATLPHVLKFSGGRSSGMLLFTLLESGILKQERGDVIVFNNTSAEHPETYAFVERCREASIQYGVPFFLSEFQTYEDSRRGEWTRLPTYRLVNANPKSDENPNGFHWRGEIFEEVVSWKGFIPNQFRRICTKHLKLETTRAFFVDWFSGKDEIPRLGHHGEASRMNPDAMYRRHLASRGKTPRDIYIAKRQHLWSRPHFRPSQRYVDYWEDWKPFNNQYREGAVFGGTARFRKKGAEYVSFIGLRHDEPSRVERVASSAWIPCEPGREHEHVYMPLADMGATRDDVNAFWRAQSWDLDLPDDASLSNCTYCFLKGAAHLRKVHAYMDGNKALDGTPSDVRWWKNMEAKYARDYTAQGEDTRLERGRIGFFGARSFSYDDVTSDSELGALAETILPCDCTE